MKLLPAAALLAAFAACASPAFAGCEEEFDALSKAISNPVTMAAGHRAAMMRMAVTGYDHCMAGDPKSFDNIRDQVMDAIRSSLGEH
jgi:hypothetical protein